MFEATVWEYTGSSFLQLLRPPKSMEAAPESVHAFLMHEAHGAVAVGALPGELPTPLRQAEPPGECWPVSRVWAGHVRHGMEGRQGADCLHSRIISLSGCVREGVWLEGPFCQDAPR